MRIAINGMGRIGRLLFRRLMENEQFEVVAVNDIMPIENLAYL
jgi:glyceraldehyde 3-phosphate dehydrogenase